MNVVLFGATGMVGQGVLRECLLDPTPKPILEARDINALTADEPS